MYNTLRINIKNKLEKNNISVRELEKRAGLKPSTLQNIVLGRSKNPSINTLLVLSKALKCSIDELISTTPFCEGAPIESSVDIVWNSKLFNSIANYITDFLEAHSFGSINLDKTLECIKEIYIYSSKSNYIMDEKFAEWILQHRFLRRF